MHQPPEFEVQEEGKVCKLDKSLYGLKQSPKEWFDKFNKIVVAYRMKQCRINHFVFIWHSSSEYIILAVAMVDVIITGTCVAGIDELEIYWCPFTY